MALLTIYHWELDDVTDWFPRNNPLDWKLDPMTMVPGDSYNPGAQQHRNNLEVANNLNNKMWTISKSKIIIFRNWYSDEIEHVRAME